MIKKQYWIAVLITELEREDPFIFKDVDEYKNMYMVRSEYYGSFMLLIYNLTMKTKEFNKKDLELKTKQEISSEFNKFKEDVLSGVIKKINEKINEIKKETNKIRKFADVIENTSRKISEKFIGTLVNKLADIRINKIIKRLEN